MAMKIIVIDDEVAEAFVGDDPKAHHQAEEQLKAEIRRRLDNPTDEEQFEDEKRQNDEGLLVRAEILETGDLQCAYIDEDGDYILFTGPKFSVQKNEYPGTSTTQLTIKRFEPLPEEDGDDGTE